MIFYISWSASRIKLLDSSKWMQGWVYYGCLKICVFLKQPEVPRKYLYVFFFFRLYRMKFQTFSNHENYTSYYLGRPFKMTKRPIFLSVSSFYYSHFRISFQKMFGSITVLIVLQESQWFIKFVAIVLFS